MSSEDQLRKDAAKLRDEINNVIKELKEHHHRVNITKTASSSVSVLGGGESFALLSLNIFKINRGNSFVDREDSRTVNGRNQNHRLFYRPVRVIDGVSSSRCFSY